MYSYLLQDVINFITNVKDLIHFQNLFYVKSVKCVFFNKETEKYNVIKIQSFNFIIYMIIDCS